MKNKRPSTFRPRARLMLLLGDQLIRDAGIAVFELVKNAYDADATQCKVTLSDVHLGDEEACITVEDDGHGMDLKTIKTIWLSPGTRNRLSQRQDPRQEHARSKKFHRLPLGEKGVGRFAVHKLGNRVELVTRAANRPEVVVSIDWEQFDSDKPLDAVPVAVRQRKPLHFLGTSTGTHIRITGLRELPWNRRRVRSLHRAITSICSPLRGPGSFEAVLKLAPDPDNWLSGMLSARQAIKLALFHFRGQIENDSMVYDYDFLPPSGMNRVEPRHVERRKVFFPRPKETAKRKLDADEDERLIELQGKNIGPIEFDFSIFDRERQTLTMIPGDPKTLTDFLDHNGGVRVYRDGVRVYDFGEPGNDWLDLGGRRVNVPTRRIGNNQITGTVRLNLPDSADLIEKTNREGFVENQAYEMFRRAVRFAVAQAESERNQDKQRIRRAYAAPSQKEPVLGDLQSLRDEITTLNLEGDIEKKLRHYLDQIDIQYREVLDRLLTAAGAGLNLALVLHEVEKEIKTLYSALERKEPLLTVVNYAKHLAELVDSLTWLVKQSGKSRRPGRRFYSAVPFRLGIPIPPSRHSSCQRP